MLLTKELFAPDEPFPHVGDPAGVNLNGLPEFREGLGELSTGLFTDIPHLRETVIAAYGSNYESAFLSGGARSELIRHGNNCRDET
jgi:hypothetical protein